MSGWVKNSPVKIRPCFVAVYEKIKKKSNWESYPSFGEVQRGLGGWSNQLVSLLVSLQNEDI